MSLSVDSNKSLLRKGDMKLDNYPSCAVEALTRLETLIASRNKQNMVMQIISEYIFLERTGKDGDVRKSQALPISQMNLFQEFQLIIALIEYFSRPGRDATRNAIFLSLFGSHLNPQRSKLLSRLISTAVSGSVAPLLSSAGTWMQQVGCKTPLSLEVAQNIVSDFISYSRKTPEQLKQLPMVGPHFAANFMVAVADLYLNEQRSQTLNPPPDALLDTITEWMTENPTLCQASQQPLVLPAGAIAMPFATPLAGLLRWVVLAPLVSNRSAYSNLHLSLLRALQQLVSSGESTALPSQELMQIVKSLQNYCTRLGESKTDPDSDAAYQKCMERFAQAVQIALSSNCISNQIQLLCLLESLPPHKLMKIVIEAHKK
ncbi:integrator complex subunit 15 [Drosophila gunungcola]|uniref:integrator complex subunit 15 n=1 Tax=Drosophila gunungcola TaxID=103775 RepID=UPI0022E87451|nr:integrator complex subunit 15 [Drosophila gunungcola]